MDKTGFIISILHVRDLRLREKEELAYGLYFIKVRVKIKPRYSESLSSVHGLLQSDRLPLFLSWLRCSFAPKPFLIFLLGKSCEPSTAAGKDPLILLL